MRAEDAFQHEDERRAKAAQSGQRTERKRIPWFKIQVNESAKIRFLGELSSGIGLWRHNRDSKPFSVSCFSNEEYSGAGAECPFCEEGSRKSVEYFWPVYNYTTQQVELLSFKDTSFTPVAMLRAFYEENQTVRDRDFTIRRMPASRNPESGRSATSYMAIPNAPTNFLVTNLSVPTDDEVIEYLRPFVPKNG